MLLLLSVLLAALPAGAAVNVVATTQDLAALTDAVGGSTVTTDYIARGDLDPHFIDAKPSFMVKLSKADLVLSVGMELEIGWLPGLVAGSRNPKIAAGGPGNLDLSGYVTRIEVPTGTIDRSRGDLHPGGNPHYWLNPENGRKMARVIAGRLSTIDPAHAADYTKNLATFEAQLTTKQAQWAAKMAPLRGTNMVGYHATFDYFCTVYGLNIIGFVEPKPGIPPSPSHTLQLGQAAKAAGARWIFVEPYKNPDDARPVATLSGARVLQLPTSVGAESGIETYFDLFDSIVLKVAG
ncbi:MAG: zinc ABC transporter substrate-binding protein [Myxococcales bacterium]|nr:zinc ABC transporter substrate-binding protein [Myxococcales bacterium]